MEGLGIVPEAKRKAEKLKEAKGRNDDSLWDIGGSHGNLEKSFLEIKFGEELGTKDSGGEICNGW